MDKKIEIDWYICRADRRDVEHAKKEGRTIKAGDELWRSCISIGDVTIEHGHLDGWHFDCTPEQAEVMRQALEIYENTKMTPNDLVKKAGPICFNSKIVEEMKERGITSGCVGDDQQAIYGWPKTLHSIGYETLKKQQYEQV